MVPSILVVVLIVLLLGVVPTWPYNSDWSYYPTGFLGAALLVMVILILAGAL